MFKVSEENVSFKNGVVTITFPVDTNRGSIFQNKEGEYGVTLLLAGTPRYEKIHLKTAGGVDIWIDIKVGANVNQAGISDEMIRAAVERGARKSSGAKKASGRDIASIAAGKARTLTAEERESSPAARRLRK